MNLGMDANDLPLDDFCRVIVHELDSLTSKPPPSVDEWVFSPRNHPFHNVKGTDVTAQDLRRASLEEVRSLLSVTSNDNKLKPATSPRIRKRSTDPDERTLDGKNPHDTVVVNFSTLDDDERQASNVKDHHFVAAGAFESPEGNHASSEAPE
jgi:hypothetical protein